MFSKAGPSCAPGRAQEELLLVSSLRGPGGVAGGTACACGEALGRHIQWFLTRVSRTPPAAIGPSQQFSVAARSYLQQLPVWLSGFGCASLDAPVSPDSGW